MFRSIQEIEAQEKELAKEKKEAMKAHKKKEQKGAFPAGNLGKNSTLNSS